MPVPVFILPPVEAVVMMILILINIHCLALHMSCMWLFFVRGGHGHAGHTAQAGTNHGTFFATDGRTDGSTGSSANRTSQHSLAIHIACHYRGRNRGNYEKRQNSHSFHHVIFSFL